MKKSITWVLVLVMMLASLTACGNSGSSQGAAADGGTAGETVAADNNSGGAGGGTNARDTLVVAIPEPPVYMDPHIQTSTATFRVTTQVYDRLTQMDTDLSIKPMLAESWEVIDEYTTQFNLREGVVFHDGEVMTAEDVKYSLERCMASDGVNYNYQIIESVDIIDDLTVTVTTKEPFNAMPTRLSLDAAAIVSKKAAESTDDFNANPVGSGPFKYSSWDIGGDCVLEAHEDYWAGASPIKTLIFRPIPEAINRTIGLETGEVDIAYDLDNTDEDTVVSHDNLEWLTVQSCRVVYLGSCVKNDILDDVLVRQALAYAVNKQDFIDIVFNGAADQARNSMLCDYLFGYAPDTVSYDTDIEKAKELLAQAGYPDGFSISLTVMDTQEYQTAAVVIQDQLKKIGVDVEVKSMDNASFLEFVAEGSQELFIYEKVATDPDSMLRTQYHTASLGRGGNRHHWTSPEVDEMLDVAARSLDENERLELYEEIQTILAEAVPLYPISVPYLNIGTQNDIQGFKIHPTNCHFIYGTEITG